MRLRRLDQLPVPDKRTGLSSFVRAVKEGRSESRAMRILLTIHHELELNSGAPGTTLRLADAYRHRGHEVEIIGFDELLPSKLPEQAKMLAFPWAVAARLARVGHRPHFDVIDASTGDSWLIGALRPCFPPSVRRSLLVSRSHGLEHTMAERRRAARAAGGQPLSWRYPLYHGGYRLWEVTQSLKTADAALFLNRHDAALAVERLGVSLERVTVVRNGILDALIGLPPPRPSPPVGGQIAVIGSYVAMKGVAHAAAAFNAWLPRHPGWAVTFLGSSMDRSGVLVDYERSLHDRITVVPRYSNADLPRLLEGHQIHLFPSLSEGGPLSLIEAMACGLVTVASAIPGVTDLVAEGNDAVLVPAAEPHAIVAALDRLAADRVLMDRLRTNAHITAQSYGWRTVADEQLAVYETHLGRRHKTEPAR